MDALSSSDTSENYERNCNSLSFLQPSVMLKIWTEEFLSVSSIDKGRCHCVNKTSIYIHGKFFSDYTEAGTKIYCITLPRSGWKKL